VLAQSNAGSADAALLVADAASATVGVSIAMHVFAWGVPLMGMIFALVSRRMQYPFYDSGLFCFVTSYEYELWLWPWALFFAPVVLVGLLLLLCVPVLLVTERRAPRHRQVCGRARARVCVCVIAYSHL
jgi:hypothetical protein